MTDLGREPYRVLFPVALLCAAAGVVPWVLFARGLLPVWPGHAHATVMSQGFFVAAALGFLGTMAPRRTGARPLSTALVIALGAGTVAASAAMLAGAVVVAEALYLSVLGTFCAVAVRRLRAAASPPPPSFVLVAAGGALGATGAALLAVAALGGPAWAFPTGRALVSQGTMLCLVLAVAPILVPAILRGQAGAGTRPPGRYVVAALLIATSFVVEQAVSIRLGLALRGLVCAVFLVEAGALAPATKGGAHRAAFRLALLLVPLGLLAAAASPERRMALLHITFAGGFALMIVAVTVHVTVVHGGRSPDRWPLAVVATVVCLLAAMALRATLEGFADRYVQVMTLAASLWLAAVAAWAGFLAVNLRRR